MTDNTQPGQEETAPVEKPVSKRMTDAEYAEAKELFELGSTGLSDLAAKFGISRQALSKRFIEDNVTRGSRAHEVSKAVASTVVLNAQAAVAKETDKFEAKRLEWIEETRVQGYNVLKQVFGIATKIFVDNHKGGFMPAKIDGDMKALGRLQKLLSENLETRLGRILRDEEVLDPDNLPSLTIEDLTEQNIIDHQRDIGALDDDTDIDELVNSMDGVRDLAVELDDA